MLTQKPIYIVVLRVTVVTSVGGTLALAYQAVVHSVAVCRVEIALVRACQVVAVRQGRSFADIGAC